MDARGELCMGFMGFPDAKIMIRLCMSGCVPVYIFLGEALQFFITFSKETMTHKRLRTTLVQAPHIRGEEIGSKEENDCPNSHSQDQNPGFLTPSSLSWFSESGLSYLQ